MKNKPVIAIDGRYGLRSPREGVGEYVYQLLVQLGFRHDRPYDVEVFGDLSADPDVVRRLRFLFPVDLLMSPSAFSWEQMAFPQVVRSASLVHGATGMAPLISRKPLVLTIPDVLDWKDDGDDPERKTFPERLRRFYYLHSVKRLARRAKTIFATSQYARDDIGEVFHIPPTKILVAPWAPKWEATPPCFPKKPYFVTVGQSHRQHNLEGVFYALSRMSSHDGTLRVLGITPRALSDVEAQVHAMGLSGRVTFETALPDEALKVLYQEATGFIDLSFHGGSNQALLDAMALGCPVIASQTAAHPELVGEAGLTVDPHHLDDAARAMDKLTRDPDLLRQLSQAGYERVLSYQWKETANLTHQGYLDTLSSLGKI